MSTMENPVFLRGEESKYENVNVNLVILQEGDTPLLLDWINNPEIRRYTLRRFPVFEANERDWLKKMSEDRDNNQVFGMAGLIEGEEDWRLIGVAGVHHINWVDRRGDIGIFIGEKEHQEKGYGTAAIDLLLRHCFLTLNLEKVCAGILANNPRSLSLAKKHHAVQEGLLAQHHFVQGEWVDEVRFAVYRKRWLSAHKQE